MCEESEKNTEQKTSLIRKNKDIALKFPQSIATLSVDDSKAQNFKEQRNPRLN